MTSEPTRYPKLLWVAMAVCGLASFAAFAIPMYVIRPFRAQGATELAVALVVRRWGPGLAVVAALLSLSVALLLWRGASGWRVRAAAVTMTVLTLLFAGLSQVNVYELMFHPAGDPQFVAAADAKVEQDDMVLAVSLNGADHAYPIRTMGYHHIANDWVGGVPIAATY